MTYMLYNPKNYFIYVFPLLVASALLVTLNVTSPLTMGPAGILFIFILLYVFTLALLFAIVKAAVIILSYFIPLKKIASKRLYYQISIIAFAPVFLLALNSLGQLEIKDFVLVSLLVGVACFYVSRRR